jgi:hypothetical protein
VDLLRPCRCASVTRFVYLYGTVRVVALLVNPKARKKSWAVRMMSLSIRCVPRKEYVRGNSETGKRESGRLLRNRWLHGETADHVSNGVEP